MTDQPIDLRPPGSATPVGASGELVVGRLRRRHLRQVLLIEAAEPGDSWSVGLFLAELGREERSYLVARRGTRVLGYTGMLFAADDAHITTITVRPEARRQRIATRMLLVQAHRARRRGVRAMTLEVRAGNEPAIALYRAFGFAPAGVRRAYYADTGEDALVMWADEVGSPDYAARLEALEAASGGPITEDG